MMLTDFKRRFEKTILLLLKHPSVHFDVSVEILQLSCLFLKLQLLLRPALKTQTALPLHVRDGACKDSVANMNLIQFKI